MSKFVSEAGCAVRVLLEEHEAEILRNLLGEMQSMLDAGTSNDPVMERLFPRAYEGDSDEESYRDLIGSELENAKKNALSTVAQNLREDGPVDERLSHGEAGDWLTALTDIRLAIGTRVGATEETMAAELDPDDDRAPALAVLHWLGWVQESILERMSSEGQNDA